MEPDTEFIVLKWPLQLPDHNPTEHHLDMASSSKVYLIKWPVIIYFPLQVLSDEAAKVMYQMKRATSVRGKNGNPTEIQKNNLRKTNEALVETNKENSNQQTKKDWLIDLMFGHIGL